MKMKRIVALLLAVVMVFGLAACGGGEEVVDPNKVVAKVGDVEITQSQWDKYNNLVCYGQGYDLSAMEGVEGYEAYLVYLKASMLMSLVSSKMLEMDYEAQGVDVLGENYEAELADFLTNVHAMIEDFIKEHELTDEDLTMYYDSQQYLAFAMNEVAATEEEALAFYEENPDYFKATEEKIRASHILVEDKELAEQIIAELDGGADFAALAAEHGTDGTKTTGGDLGPFVYSDMVEEFSEAAFQLAKGEYTKEPVKSDFGYHVILCTEKLAEGDMQPYEWVEETIYSDLDSQAYYAKLDELNVTYPAEYFVEGLTSDGDIAE